MKKHSSSLKAITLKFLRTFHSPFDKLKIMRGDFSRGYNTLSCEQGMPG